MKKNMVRVVALLLVAMLALTLIPMGAMAITVNVQSEAYGSVPDYGDWTTPNEAEHSWDSGLKSGHSSVTIKTSDYDRYVVMDDGCEYDLKGIVDYDEFDDWDWSKDNSDRDLPLTSSLTFKEKDYGDFTTAWLVYAPHKHALTGWISDGTTHWKNCTVCRDKFIGQNWCQDGDEDKICNVCGGDVPYHDITAEGPDGYTVTLNRDNASHRTKITAKVDAPAGAQYKLHFIKVRTDGSEQEITRYKENGEFYTRMPTYSMKVVIEPIQ